MRSGGTGRAGGAAEVGARAATGAEAGGGSWGRRLAGLECRRWQVRPGLGGGAIEFVVHVLDTITDARK